MENVIDLSKFKEIRDLKEFTNHLYSKLLEVTQENARLIEKINHLEQLLKNCPVPTIG